MPTSTGPLNGYFVILFSFLMSKLNGTKFVHLYVPMLFFTWNPRKGVFDLLAPRPRKDTV